MSETTTPTQATASTQQTRSRRDRSALNSVALEIFKAKTIHRSRQDVSVNVRESFMEAQAFLEYSEGVENGSIEVDRPRTPHPAVKVNVKMWDVEKNAPLTDEFQRVMHHDVPADVDAWAGGLPSNHPINEAFIKGRLQIGLSIPKIFKEDAERYAREMNVPAIIDN